MNKAAIWHEATQRYCFCIEPGRFRFRLQAGQGDMKRVLLHSRDKYLPLKWKDTRRVTEMKWVAGDGLRDYYEAELEFQVVCLRYYFELEDNNGERCFFSNSGFTAQPPEDIERFFDCPQTLREEERFITPGWAANKVVYQVFPARFATDQAVSGRVWYQAPIGPKADLKGNLKGVTDRLEYIRDLGADVVYMTPIFRSDSTHKYDTIDYYTIDPSFGTREDLCRLVDKAHSLGLRVILDGVFNHTSPKFFAFEDLKKNQEKSAYRDWYYVESFPMRTLPGRHNYKCFGYFFGMPKLNLQCQEAADYFVDVALYWLRTAKIDGWRLDVADEISHSFWKRLRREVKREFPEALIVGEVWHHAPDFLQGDEWDSVMNYPFYRAVLDFAAEGTMTASAFLGSLGFQRGNTHTAAYPLLWNLIGSHDTARIRNLCGEDSRKHRLAAALQLLLPGMPMIYYGDEVGMTGGRDPDCRRGMLWDRSKWDHETYLWYQRLLRLRRDYPIITCGEPVGQTALDDQGLITMTRRWEGREVTLLFHGKDDTVTLPELAVTRDLLTDAVFDGTLGPWAAAVLLK